MLLVAGPLTEVVGPLVETVLVLDCDGLLTYKVGPRVPEGPGVQERLHPPPPGRVFDQHLVAELAEEVSLSLGTRDVGITEIVLHKEALNGIHGPVPRVDKCHGSPKDPQSCLEF